MSDIVLVIVRALGKETAKKIKFIFPTGSLNVLRHRVRRQESKILPVPMIKLMLKHVTYLWANGLPNTHPRNKISSGNQQWQTEADWGRLPPAEIETVLINFKAWSCRAGHLGISYLDSSSQNISLYPSTWSQASLPSYKDLLAMLILRSFSRSTQSETLGWGFSNLFQQALQWSSRIQKFRIAGLGLRGKEDLLLYLTSWSRPGLVLGWSKHGG